MSPIEFIAAINQVFVIIMVFMTSDGVRHQEQMPFAFTSEVSCETYARKVNLRYHRQLPGLYWWCEPNRVNP